MTDKRHDQKPSVSEPKPRKVGEQVTPIEADGQLDLGLHTAADLDAILIERFN